jgi:hypothetical protein
MTAETDQLTRIHALARVLWGPGDYNVAVSGQLVTLSRDGVELSQVRLSMWQGSALDGLERTLRQRAADIS